MHTLKDFKYARLVINIITSGIFDAGYTKRRKPSENKEKVHEERVNVKVGIKQHA